MARIRTMLHINVTHILFGDERQLDGLTDISFTLPIDSISVSDLIARTVELQITDLLDRRAQSNAQAQALLDRQFLDEADVSEQAIAGKISLARPKIVSDTTIDVKLEQRRAIDAFVAKRYMIFINGRNFTDLDEHIAYADAVKVKFMRIMPLVGG